MNTSQRLKRGKALCGKVFSGFVETFNALVDFKDNLKGDDDVSRGNGHIRVDRANPRFPIIRCKGCNADGGGITGLPITGDAPTSLTDEDEDLLVSNIRYDAESHQLQVRVRGVNIEDDKITSMTPVSDWLMIDGGQCVEHQQESES